MNKTKAKGKPKAPRVEIIQDKDCRVVNATGVFGGLNAVEGVLMLYSDYPYPSSEGPPGQVTMAKVVREIQVVLKLSPITFKMIADWMQGHIQEFEKQFGALAKKKLPEQPGVTNYIG